MKNFTIHSPVDGGGSVAVTISVTGPDSAVITIAKYTQANPPDGTVPIHSEHHGLVRIRLAASGTGIVCQLAGLLGQPFGHVTCMLHDGSGPQDRSATMSIADTALFDGERSYRLGNTEYQGLATFIASAGFKKA